MNEQFTITLPKDLCDLLDALVAKYGSDRSGFITDAIYEYYSDERNKLNKGEHI